MLYPLAPSFSKGLHGHVGQNATAKVIKFFDFLPILSKNHIRPQFSYEKNCRNKRESLQNLGLMRQLQLCCLFCKVMPWGHYKWPWHSSAYNPFWKTRAEKTKEFCFFTSRTNPEGIPNIPACLTVYSQLLDLPWTFLPTILYVPKDKKNTFSIILSSQQNC